MKINFPLIGIFGGFGSVLLATWIFFLGNTSIYKNLFLYAKGRIEYGRAGFEEASTGFDPRDLEIDLTSKHFLVTGGNSGIGFATALELARRNGTVHLVCRSEGKAMSARKDLVEKTKNPKIHIHVVDLSLPKDIMTFVNKFKEHEGKLDVLINNAGVLLNEKEITADGLDKSFASNTLNYYLLTKGLLDMLKRSSDPRVVMVSSGGMYTQRLEYEDFNFRRWVKFNGPMAYSQNKRHQVVMCEEFAKDYPEIFFASMHPGWTDTPGVERSLPDFYKSLKNELRLPSQGADSVVWLAIAPQITKRYSSGRFFQDRKPVDTHFPLAWTKYTDEQSEMFMEKLELASKRALPS